MHVSPNEEEIARRAREIWEEEGRPEGRHLEHWQQAERELGGDGTAAVGNEAAPEVAELPPGDQEIPVPVGAPD
jgi:hypothetical protein